VLTEVERSAVESHLAGSDLERPSGGSEVDQAVFVGLRWLLEAGQLVREQRSVLARPEATIKGDGSPSTDVEEAIELRLRELLASLDSEAVVVGEETGGDLPEEGLAVAIDPIDGTWAFLTETETYSTTLALIRDRRTVLGMISNPVTGEVAYATDAGGARLLRLSLFG